MKPKKVAIVGGGIGGLSMALALCRMGIPFDVYEQAEEIKEVGAGLVLYPNTFKLLKRLGIGQIFVRRNFVFESAEFCRADGRVLTRMDFSHLLRDFGEHCYPVHRSELISTIAEPLPVEQVHLGHRCTRVEQDSEGATIHFANGKSVRTGCLVGADGIHSTIRQSLIRRDATRYSGQTCFRGVACFSHKTPRVLREISGAGKRMGMCALSEQRLYWWAAVNAEEGKMIPFEQRLEFLLDLFRGWPWQAPECIEATSYEAILQNDLIDRRPIDRWSLGMTTLIGDAAHPTTPNLGQGANMAIEDAIVLTRCLVENRDLQTAFAHYEDQRLKHTAKAVSAAWRFGKLAKWRHPLAVKSREALLQLLNSVALRQFNRIISYDAGELPQR